jgi:NAD(P)-dependent dehydrogenase (short-subunit alcohol dehydrogenase family)
MDQTSEYYRDQVAVVTGGASGIGLALAETLLRHGAKQVVLADFNDENLKREAARLNSACDGRVLGVHCNVTKEEDVQAMIQEAVDFGGRIDILFNNAGRHRDLERQRTGRAFGVPIAGAGGACHSRRRGQ